MLETLRELGNKKVVRLFFALFLIIPFGLFGIDFYFRSPVGGDTVASVGSARIGAVEYDNALRQQAETYRQQFRGSFDASFMDNPEVKRAVLDRLVNEKLLDIGSQRAGVRFSDKQLAERIAAEPAFQIEGRFSKDRYEQVARAQGLSPIGLDERLRQDYRQVQFRSSIADTAFVPKSTLDSFIRLSEQTREVSMVQLAPEAYAARVKITPEQVKTYYEGHPAEFTTPERARAEFVEFSVDSLAAKALAPAEEVKRLYDDGMLMNKWGTQEERRASHILISVKPGAKPEEKKAAEEKARAIAEQVRKNPKAFADIAKKESQDPGSGANGGDLGFFPRGAMVKPFEEAAYAAKKEEIVGPVLSDFGYHVIRVTDIKAAKVKTLAEATPELEATLKKQQATSRFAESAEAFTNIVYEQPTSLKPAADQFKLTIQTTPWFIKGAPSIPQLANPKISAELFADDAVKGKRNTQAIEVSPNVLVAARVVEYKAAERRPLDDVRADIERRLQREEGMRLAREEGEGKLKALQEGKDAGLKWPAVLAVNRAKTGGLPQQVIDKAFRIEAKKLPGFAGVETPAGYSLVQVTKVIEPEKIEDAQRDSLGAQLKQAVAMEELEATLASVRGRVGVSVRKDALEKKASSAN